MPAIVDRLDNRVNKAYGAQPDRLYLVGLDGKVAFAGARGPRGFQPDDLEDAIVAELAKTGKAPPSTGAPSVLLTTLDRDGDGTLSDEELANASRSLRSLDGNKDGKITPDELRRRKEKTDATEPGERDRGGRARGGRSRSGERRGVGRPSEERFREMDANGDGKLSKDEVPGFMKERWEFMDSDGDGFLDEKEQEALIDKIRRRSDGEGRGRPGRGERREPDRNQDRDRDRDRDTR